MAYKQKPGRGKLNPFKAMEKYTSSPIKLENGDGEDEKTKIKEKKSKYLTESDVEGSPSPKGTRVVVKDGEVYASYRPKDTGTPKIKITGGSKPTKTPKTNVKSTQGAPYGFNLSNTQLKKEMKKYGISWKGRGDALVALSSIKKPKEKLGSQDQITKTKTIEDAFKFTK